MTLRDHVRRFGAVAVVVWLVAGTALGGVLLIRHVVALPTPDVTDTALREALRRDLPMPGWRAIHFMYRACPCSRRTIAHLLEAHRPADVRELVVLVDDDGQGDPSDTRLVAAGFRVEVITPDVLRGRYHLEAAPVLVVMSPDDELAYIGGYNRHKQGPAYEDLAIISDLRAHRTARPLPVFGCATSARLARMLDPLNLAR
jgi:hypothetical protein